MVSRSFVLEGRLNKRRLKKSINFVVNLHERLRTKATKIGDTYVEEIVPKVEVRLIYKDVSTHGEIKAMARAEALYKKVCLGGMNLQVLPLIETQLLKLANQRHFFIFTINHGIADAVALELLFKQISQTYTELTQGLAPSLCPPRFSFRQYYNAYEAWLAGDNRKRLENYWKKETRDIHRYQFPFEKKQYSASRVNYSCMETYCFKDDWKNRITTFCMTQGVSKFVFLLAIVQVMIYRYLGNSVVFVSSATDTRKTPEEAEIVGDLGCSIYIKQRLKVTGSFTDLVNRLRAKVYEVIENNILGSPRLGSWVPNDEAPGAKAVHQINVMKTPETGDKLEFPGICTTPVNRRIRPASTKLNLVLCESKEDLTLALHYPPDIFVKHGIERMFFNLQWFMSIALESPQLRLNRFPDLRDRKSIRGPLTREESALTLLDRIDT
ncbi:MAG: condensation domain-containing protein [Verrucomicrobia bacterium]|nr:condensation domain-containing protein [Verrucomicrobiota bacterium]